MYPLYLEDEVTSNTVTSTKPNSTRATLARGRHFPCIHAKGAGVQPFVFRIGHLQEILLAFQNGPFLATEYYFCRSVLQGLGLVLSK